MRRGPTDGVSRIWTVLSRSMSDTFLASVAERAADAAFRIEERPLVGRIMIAARSFEAGDIVLRERPSMSWPHDRADEMFPSFLVAGAAAQASILDMAMPSVSSDLERVSDKSSRDEVFAARTQRAKERSQHAQLLAQDYEGSPRILELVEALLLIADCNAHAFEDRIGLFPIAAKANHSCNPSCAHSTKVGGEMRFYASRSIAPGEEITISYLDNVWHLELSERRQKLLLQKLFFCRCPRCTSSEKTTRGVEKGLRTGHEGPKSVMELVSMECAASGCHPHGRSCPHGHLRNDGNDAPDDSGGTREGICADVCTEHAPVAELTGEAITSFLECCKRGAESEAHQRLARWIAQRYLRWAAVLFGEHDRAVQAMTRFSQT